jgi:DNA-binding CsgD family transcriptional regulator
VAAVHLWGADHDAALYWAAQARDGARDAGCRALATALLAAAAARASDITGARLAAQDAAAVLDRLPDDRVTAHLDSLLYLGLSETTTERAASAVNHLDRALRLAPGAGRGLLLPELRYGLADALNWTGELGAAAALGGEAVESARSTGAADSLLWSMAMRTMTAIVAGDRARAAALTTEIERLDDRSCELAPAVALACRSEVRFADGDHGGCVTGLLQAGGGVELPHFSASYQPYWYQLLTESELARARPTAAAGWAERAVAAAAGLGLDGRSGWALRAQAAVRLGQHDPTGAERLARDSAQRLEAAGNPVEAARSRMVVAEALAARGRQAEALALVEVTRAEFVRCGAIGRADEARARTLRVRGAGGAGLSPREREIAELVAEGRTNREIATELTLSVKTVETHLARAFGKLSVRNRSALAARLRVPA